jgi:hypothetical protein
MAIVTGASKKAFGKIDVLRPTSLFFHQERQRLRRQRI